MAPDVAASKAPNLWAFRDAAALRNRNGGLRIRKALGLIFAQTRSRNRADASDLGHTQLLWGESMYRNFGSTGVLVLSAILWLEPEAAAAQSITTMIDTGAEAIKMQQKLNLLGYDAGEEDGYPGPQTRDALMAFQAAQCLTTTGQPDTRTIAALATTLPGSNPCDGKLPGEGITANTPLRDGVYVDKQTICHLENIPYDIVYQSVRLVRGTGIAFGYEDGCETRRTDIRRGITRFRGECNVGNQLFEHEWWFDIRTNESFTEISGLFESETGAAVSFGRCPDDSAQHLAFFPAPAAPLFPVAGPEVRLTANFRAHGAGPVQDPDAYIAGQMHLGTDFAAIPGRVVHAPVTGDIIYYHQLGNASSQPQGINTFFVLRDDSGRDWVFGHATCTACPSSSPLGDLDTWPSQNVVRVARGDPIGAVVDLSSEGYGNHLHLAVSQKPIVKEGRLIEAYRHGNWGRITYSEATAAGVSSAKALSTALGFFDPTSIVKAPEN
jgi:peptidoglycan hydrolase-like protein with peptidoglycan-binding domain